MCKFKLDKKMNEIEKLAQLIKQRNQIDNQITEIINRPALTGHIGEYIASKIFDIELEKSASAKSYDGKFRKGNLKGKTVNIKFYPKKENLLDVKDINSQPPDYYLVLTGPNSKEINSIGKTRELVINYVFLFESDDLLEKLKKRNVNIGVATSVISDYWDLVEIYPKQKKKLIKLSKEKINQIQLFEKIEIKYLDFVEK